MATSTAALDLGRSAYAEHRWTAAFESLNDADQEQRLAGPDLERLSTVAFLLGDFDLGIDTLTRAHEQFLETGDRSNAARCAIWIGIYLTIIGEVSRTSGWLARAQRLVSELPEPGSVAAFLLIPAGLGAVFGGAGDAALHTFTEALEIAVRFNDRDVTALARLGLGQSKIMLGDAADGFASLDEVMVAVTAGELFPIASGIIYCAVIGFCQLAFDPRRAQEWTAAMDHWCQARSDMVLFSGQCQAHRSELYLLHGEWSAALAAAQLAEERTRRGDRMALYGAHYQRGEVERLTGQFDSAEMSYREASRAGFDPQPGLALLRLATGQAQGAGAGIRRSAEEADLATRRLLLPAVVEIELAVLDVDAARRAADELIGEAGARSMPMAQAIAAQSDGAVLLAEGDPRAALARIRQAWSIWMQLDIPYEAARCRVLAGRACLSMGEPDAAAMEFDAAQAVFAELGALPALGELDILLGTPAAASSGPLTEREVEVLRLVAAGKTNRAIAGELFLSEKTVARHLSNIFTKLGLGSRAAATAYAYENQLV